MTAKFSDKTVFITGGGSWIGKETAKMFASQGAKVFISGRDETKLKLTCEEIIKNGGAAAYTLADVTDESSVQNAMQVAQQHFGHLDILIPNAAIYPNAELTQINLQEWNDVLSTNLTGAFLTIKSAVPFLRERGKGRIILISSVAGDSIGIAGYAAYCASKAGMNGLMRSCAVELAKDKITVNCIAPGNICNTERFDIPEEQKTKMISRIPLGHIGEPADIANLALYLASEEARFITGQIFVVDGGECIST